MSHSWWKPVVTESPTSNLNMLSLPARLIVRICASALGKSASIARCITGIAWIQSPKNVIQAPWVSLSVARSTATSILDQDSTRRPPLQSMDGYLRAKYTAKHTRHHCITCSQCWMAMHTLFHFYVYIYGCTLLFIFRCIILVVARESQAHPHPLPPSPCIPPSPTPQTNGHYHPSYKIKG